jgi:GTPase SAR1 family protein
MMDNAGVSVSTIKLIVLGESGVEKMSILNQWLHGTFSDQTLPVFRLCSCSLTAAPSPSTSGIPPQYLSVVPMYCRAASVTIILFDLTQQSTFDTVERQCAC